MAINSEDPQLLEHLTLIVDAFEKEALRSNSRNGMLVTAHSPLSGMEMLLNGSDRALTSASPKKGKGFSGSTSASEPSVGTGPGQETDASLSLEVEGEIEVDLDLKELMSDSGSGGEAAAKYLSECLDCDMRLKFDWQLKPLNLLGGIESMLQGIEASLDQFSERIDPLRSLENICDLLNAVKGLCIPDLIMIVMSLKLLVKKYLMNTLDIKLDWTTIIGPILKVVVEGISMLLNSIMGVILAPIDCAVSGLIQLNKLDKEIRSVLGSLETLGKEGFELPEGEATINQRDVEWTRDESKTQYPEAPDLGGLEAQNRSSKEPKQGGGGTFPTGFNISADMKLDDALANPDFEQNATWMEKLILPLQEAKRFIQDLVKGINKALESLNALVGGGLGLNLGKLGSLLFLTDMISMVMMIIKMLKQNRDVDDWCQLLEDNPTVLEDQIRDRFPPDSQGNQVRVEKGTDHTLLLRRGPDIVGQISTCLNHRSDANKQLLNQWIKDLERGKN